MLTDLVNEYKNINVNIILFWQFKQDHGLIVIVIKDMNQTCMHGLLVSKKIVPKTRKH